MNFLLSQIAHYGYWEIFFSLALGILGLPIPDETLMVLIGFLAFQDKLNYSLSIMVALAGTLCGVTISYFIGRISDKLIFQKYLNKMHIDIERFENAEEFYRKYGKSILFIGYFIPGVKHFTAILAGISRMPCRIFTIYAYSGALLWTVVFINLGYFLGNSWRRFAHYSFRFIIPIAVSALIIILIAMYLKPNGRNE